MTELGIYEGCYVELRNGTIEGPITTDGDKYYPWDSPDGVKCWTPEGKYWSVSNEPHEHDIVSVRIPALPPGKQQDVRPFAKPEDPTATIPPHVLTAAMDAGIKASPAYEEFVNAILKAGFQAQYGIDVSAVREKSAIDIDELCKFVFPIIAARGEQRLIPPVTLKRLVTDILLATAKFSGTPISKNESENRIRDSEKLKGGLSDLPLSDITIVFTGATKMPRDTLKGIAESLGAKVSGSVHKHTGLVVYGPGVGSKLDKANEFSLPRMSEEAWLWLATRLGYGKPQHVSPYGKIGAPAFPNRPLGYVAEQPADSTPISMRTLDKLHPATAAFLKAVFPDAPLRAVEFDDDHLFATYGRPMNNVATIKVSFSGPANIPMWVEDQPVDKTPFRIAPDLIAIALDEAERKFSKTTLQKQDIRALRIKEIGHLINAEVARCGAVDPSLTYDQVYSAALKAMDATFVMPAWREYGAKKFVEAFNLKTENPQPAKPAVSKSFYETVAEIRALEAQSESTKG